MTKMRKCKEWGKYQKGVARWDSNLPTYQSLRNAFVSRCRDLLRRATY